MAKKIRDKWLRTRVNDDEQEIVSAYVEAVHTDVANLLRVAVMEYINNHPAKEAK